MGQAELFTEVVSDHFLMDKLKKASANVAGSFGDLDPEDVENEILFDIYRLLQRYDPDRGRLRTYVSAIIGSRCSNYFRGRRQRMRGAQVYFEDLGEHWEDWMLSYEFVSSAVMKMDLDLVERKIEKVRARRIFRMLRQGYTQKEASEAEDVSRRMIAKIVSKDIKPVMESVLA